MDANILSIVATGMTAFTYLVLIVYIVVTAWINHKHKKLDKSTPGIDEIIPEPIDLMYVIEAIKQVESEPTISGKFKKLFVMNDVENHSKGNIDKDELSNLIEELVDMTKVVNVGKPRVRTINNGNTPNTFDNGLNFKPEDPNVGVGQN